MNKKASALYTLSRTLLLKEASMGYCPKEEHEEKEEEKEEKKDDKKEETSAEKKEFVS